MGVGRSRSVALIGLRGELVEIEADLSSNVPAFVLIGLPDAALGEARERVKAAAANSGCDLPARRFTVNLSPAALPKHGSAFDLGIALAALAAAGTVSTDSVARVVHLGELGLDGRVRPVPGVLPAVHAAVRAGHETVMVPEACAEEAALVDGVTVIPVRTLRAAAIWHGAALEPTDELDAADVTPPRALAVAEPVPDLADVVGNPEAVDALVLAAAGGHHLYFLGPPGAGKTMLATRLPGILPPLDHDAAIEVASIRSLAGEPITRLPERPPFEAPHHTASAAAIIGGGSGVIRPGAIARAAHGVLFLDEAPEFSRIALDALRQPLESGTITIQRATATATYPANAQLVLAANPCPCGNWGVRELECTCPVMVRRRYLGRLSGPLLDRIDLQLNVRRLTKSALRGSRGGTPTAVAAAHVAEARAAAADRLRMTPWRLNAEVPGTWLRGLAGGRALSRTATAALDTALDRGRITMRGYNRALRVAWTAADLEGATVPTAAHVGLALGLRTAVAA